MVIAQSSATTATASLFQARTVADVDRLIKSVDNARWRALGDKPGNYGPVNLIADPADALIEKITNGMDAIIELQVRLANREDLESPRLAVDQLLGVPRGHLEYLADRKARRRLATQIIVTMRDSGQEDMPTIVVEDRGIGQHPDDFPSTLVSLNENNKTGKLYLIGAYGWGGSAAIAFSRYILFISRREPQLLGRRSDEVGWTIVRYNDLADDRTSKTGVYEYLVVDDGTGNLVVPRFRADELPVDRRGWHGTACTLVSYEIGKTTARAAAFLGPKSLRNVCNALLFDPVLPFIVKEERAKYATKNPTNAQGVIVIGNAGRLSDLAAKRRSDEDQDDQPEEDRDVGVVHHDSYRATLPTGGVAVVRYWVMGESQKYKKDWQPARSYVSPDQAVTLSHNGQRHAAWTRDFFEENGYTSLGKAIVVNVNADDLTWSEKRGLFTTTRDKLKQTEVAQTLREMVKTGLQQDSWLRAEEKRRRMRALGHESKEQAERIQKMLATAISALRDADVETFRKVWSSDPEFPLLINQKLLDPEPELQPPPLDFPKPEPPKYGEDPTFIRVINGPVHVPAGGRAVVRLHLDAPDDYFERGGGFIPIVTRGGDVFKVEGYSSIREGVMRCTVSALGAAPGDKGRVIFTVTRGDALPIADGVEIEADEPPRPRVKPVGKQRGKDQGPPVKPCHRPQWEDLGFDETTVAKLIPEPDDPANYTIYVNWDYQPLDNKLLKDRKLEEATIESFKERFVAAMGFLVWLQHKASAPINNEELARSAQVHLFTSFLAN